MSVLTSRVIASTLGFDASVIRVLDDGARAALHRHVLITLVSAAAAGWSAYAASVVLEGSSTFSVVCGILTAIFVWNLLRLLGAGCGMALHLTEEEAGKWRPSVMLPTFVFLLIGAVLAQPALIALSSERIAPLLRQHRSHLAELHARSVLAQPEARAEQLQREASSLQARIDHNQAEYAAVAIEPETQAWLDRRNALVNEQQSFKARAEHVRRQLELTQAELTRLQKEDIEPYVKNLSKSAFPVFCIMFLWQDFGYARLFTALFMLIVASPLLLRMVLPADIRRYEQERRAVERRLVMRAYNQTELQCREWLEEQLGRLASLSPRAQLRSALPAPRYTDAPFNREAVPSQYSTANTLTVDELVAELRKAE